jgi:hypothetical protein
MRNFGTFASPRLLRPRPETCGTLVRMNEATLPGKL